MNTLLIILAAIGALAVAGGILELAELTLTVIRTGPTPGMRALARCFKGRCEGVGCPVPHRPKSGPWRNS
ncbi:hypothetical protein Lfu02_31420 [Longispora fulva]|uniref:Uncharacterized protein n=1 Tax=Longispora fulva TaxID=619741 RepID=A0A8J7GWS8_9ACTN|nr:hypothetical protein [Longispora fulva]MBG6139276.1 hypothetical protein [Longispora fulva]GIG58770.1 hypothetical protein Lfu02_31420 [Longispora fulva]